MSGVPEDILLGKEAYRRSEQMSHPDLAEDH